jgi:hypothetical protein
MRLIGLMPGQEKNGAPGEIRTPDLLLRRQPLYPAELRARTASTVYMGKGNSFNVRLARVIAERRRKIIVDGLRTPVADKQQSVSRQNSRQ